MHRDEPTIPAHVTRRSFLTLAGTAAAAMATASVALDVVASSHPAYAAALTKAQRDQMTPDDILALMKKGNERFRLGQESPHDYLAQQRASASGQYPAAVILSCIDSRAPAETIMDLGIGDCFNARVAGNIANDDLIGSLEFACEVAGAKVVLVMGHTACGAIKGAIDDVEMGNLTGLLARIKPAISATTFDGEKSSKNAAYVDAVARTNVVLGLEAIRRRSPILANLEKERTILLVGAMYDLSTGAAEFLS